LDYGPIELISGWFSTIDGGIAMSDTSVVNEGVAASMDGDRLAWVRPEMKELDVLETAQGTGGSDGMGGGGGGANESGS